MKFNINARAIYNQGELEEEEEEEEEEEDPSLAYGGCTNNTPAFICTTCIMSQLADCW